MTPPSPRSIRISNRNHESTLGDADRRLDAALNRIKFITILALSIAVVVQCFAEPAANNILSAVLALLATTATMSYAFRRRMLQTVPLSALSLIGLSLTTSGVALIGQSLAFRPLDYNLQESLATFAISLGASLIAIGTHAVYRALDSATAARSAISIPLLKPIGLFRAPSTAEFWIVGIVGLLAMWQAKTASASAAMQYGDVSGKFLQSISVFALVPFLIPFRNILLSGSGQIKQPPLQMFFVGVYFLVMLVTAFASNSRATFSTGVLLLLLCMLLSVVTGRLRLSANSIIIAGLAGVLFIPLFSLLNDASTSMLINRDQRAYLSPVDLVRNTISTMENKDLLEDRRHRDSIISSGYNEIYMKNEFLMRFSVTKYIDLNLYHTMNGLTDLASLARENAARRISTLLPTPIAQRLGIQVDKKQTEYSSGDFYRLYASRGMLGGYTTGASLVDGLVMFGAGYLLIGPIFFFVFFCVFDALSLPSGPNSIAFSPLALIQINRIFYGNLSMDSVAAQVLELFRFYPERILTYTLVFLGAFVLVRVFSPIFGRATSAPSVRTAQP